MATALELSREGWKPYMDVDLVEVETAKQSRNSKEVREMNLTLRDLPIEQRIRLVEDLWDSLRRQDPVGFRNTL